MGKLFDALNDDLKDFMARQQMFFVGSAPLTREGHVNISPKGMDSFRVLDDHTVAYLDLTGSGVETLSHVKENGRLVIMFCAFEGSPLTVRLYGQGEVLERGHADFDGLLALFPELPGIRSIIRLKLERIADSCGWTVPVYEHRGSRDYYENYAEKKGPEGMRSSQLASNMESIDGLKGLDAPSF